MRENEEEAEQIARDATVLRDLYRDIQQHVAEQGESLQEMEHNMEGAVDKAEGATRHLDKVRPPPLGACSRTASPPPPPPCRPRTVCSPTAASAATSGPVSSRCWPSSSATSCITSPTRTSGPSLSAPSLHLFPPRCVHCTSYFTSPFSLRVMRPGDVPRTRFQHAWLCGTRARHARGDGRSMGRHKAWLVELGTPSRT